MLLWWDLVFLCSWLAVWCCWSALELWASSSYYLAPLTPPSSPPHNTQLRSGVGGWSLFSLSLTELSSRADLGSNLNVEDNVGVVVRNVVVTVVVTVTVTVLLVGLKGAAAWEVWSRQIVTSRHHLPPLQQLGLPGMYFILMMPHCWHPLSVSAALLNCCSSNDHGNTPDWAWTSSRLTSGNIELKNMNILKSISCKYIQWM